MDIGALSLRISDLGGDKVLQTLAQVDQAAARLGGKSAEVTVAAPTANRVQAALSQIQATAGGLSARPTEVRVASATAAGVRSALEHVHAAAAALGTQPVEVKVASPTAKAVREALASLQQAAATLGTKSAVVRIESQGGREVQGALASIQAAGAALSAAPVNVRVGAPEAAAVTTALAHVREAAAALTTQPATVRVQAVGVETALDKLSQVGVTASRVGTDAATGLAKIHVPVEQVAQAEAALRRLGASALLVTGELGGVTKAVATINATPAVVRVTAPGLPGVTTAMADVDAAIENLAVDGKHAGLEVAAGADAATAALEREAAAARAASGALPGQPSTSSSPSSPSSRPVAPGPVVGTGTEQRLAALIDLSKRLDVTSAQAVTAFRQEADALAVLMRQAGATAGQLSRLEAVQSRVLAGARRVASAQNPIPTLGPVQLGPVLPPNLAKQARDAASGVSALGAGLTGISRILPALGIAAATQQILSFARGTIEAADALHDLRERTGVSVESLSVLQQVAVKSGASNEGLAVGLRNLAKQVTALRAGNQEATASFAALGLSAKDLQDLSIDQVLERVATAQAKFADGAGKTALAMKLFGRSGEELIPTLNELANGGFAEATRKAEALGGVVSGKFADQADEFNDAVADMKAAAGGLGRGILSDVLPPLTSLINGLISFRQRAREATDAAPGWVRELIKGTQQAMAAGPLYLTVFGDKEAEAARARSFLEWVTETGRRLIGLQSSAEATSAALAKTFKPQGPPAPKKPDLPVIDPEKAKAMAAARAAAGAQAAQTELAIVQARLDREEVLNKNAFERGAASLDAYYAKRSDIIKRRTEANIAALEKERQLLAKAPPGETEDEAIKRRAELARIGTRSTATKPATGRIAEVELGGGKEQQQNFQDRLEAEKNLAERIAGFQRVILDAQGNTHAIRLQQIDEEATKYREVLVAQGKAPEAIDAQVQAFVRAQTAQADFNEAQRESGRIFEQLAAARATVQDQVERGQISQQEGEQQIAAEEQKRLPVLRQNAAAMLAFATALQNPELIAAAQRLNATLNAMAQGPITGAEMLQRRFQDILDGLRDQGTETAKAIEKELTRRLEKQGGQATPELDTFGETLAGMGQDIDDQFATFGLNAGKTFSSAMTAGLIDAFEGGGVSGFFKTAGNVILSGLGGILTQMGEALIATGLALVGLLPALSNIFTSGPAMIVAGALITAAGAALGAIATKGKKGGAAAPTGAQRAAAPTERAPIPITLDPDRDLHASRAQAVAPKVTAPQTIKAVAPPPVVQIGTLMALDPNDPKWQRNISATVQKATRRNLQPA